MAGYQAARRASIAEIGEIPPIADPARRERSRESLRDFCETYRPAAFYLGWSDDHLRVIERIETTCLAGGLFGLAMPRGSGKTTLAITAALWALLYGHKKWVCLIGATQPKAVSLLKAIKTELRFNELFLADFPEVCYPIKKVEGKAIRAASQTHEGVSTAIEWTVDKLTLPTIPGSLASGSRVSVCGITGDIRGQQETTQDGRVLRPDYVIPDDPQTRESAKSPTQTEDRLAILNGDILGLAGPGVKISGVLPCTVISPGDLADQILDREVSPEWHGEKTQLLYGFPEATELWEQYQTIRENDLRNDGDGSVATEFYVENREAMDRGARAAWAERHAPDEISGIQHAMNLYFRDEAAFFAEYQNEPREDKNSDLLTVQQIQERTNEFKRLVLPEDAQAVTGMIDVQKEVLFYVLIAWRGNFTGSIIDYGSFPDQGTTNFRYSQARKTLSRAFGGASFEVKLTRGLKELTSNLCGKLYKRADGSDVPLTRLFIDANWGESRDIVYAFVRNSPHRGVIMPSHGKYIGAASEPLNSKHKKKAKCKVGLNWRVDTTRDMPLRHVVYDTNFWKSFFHSRLAAEPGTTGSLTLYKAPPGTHKTFAFHCHAEYPTKTEGRNRIVHEWKLRPDRPDNHWFDCAVGACVAASVEHCELPGMATRAAKKPKRRERGVSYL